MSAPSRPRVSIAIPLYRSGRFVPIILENIANLDEPRAEILISDRHGEDEAIDLLEERLHDDPRIRFLRANDRIHWADHYNELLRTARGDLFLWMPHDDSFPRGYVTRLAAALDEHADVVLAFGRIEAVDPEGVPIPGWTFHDPPFGSRSRGVRDALGLLHWGSAIPFRGIFRRHQVVAAGLFLRSHVRGTDGHWTFGLALRGSLLYVPDVYCVKRYYRESTWASAPYRVGDVVDSVRVLRSYVSDAPLRAGARFFAVAGVLGWGAVRILGRLLPRFLRPAGYRLAYLLLPPSLRPGQRRFRSSADPFR